MIVLRRLLCLGFLLSWVVATLSQPTEHLQTVFVLSQQAAFWFLLVIVVEYLVEVFRRGRRTGDE